MCCVDQPSSKWKMAKKASLSHVATAEAAATDKAGVTISSTTRESADTHKVQMPDITLAIEGESVLI
jgi:hypothetical protein